MTRAIGLAPAPAAAMRDARLAVALGVSVAAHLMLLVAVGDGGPRPAPPAGTVLTARLSGSEPSASAGSEAGSEVQAQRDVLADARADANADRRGEPAALVPPEAAATLAPLADARVPTGAEAAASAGAVPPAVAPRAEGPRGDAHSAASAIPGPAGVPSPGPIDRAAPPQPPLPPATAGSGWVPGWFAARELDVLPRPLTPVEFAVPAAARASGLSGKVELQLSIDASGMLVDIEVLRADPRGVFEASALAAFRAVRYSPGYKDGRAVRSRIRTVAVFDATALAGSELPR